VTTYLLFVHSESWITLSTLVHIISSSTTLTYGLVIDVVMAINKIGQYTTVRSLGQIQQKSIKEEEEGYAFQRVMDEMEDRINRLPTRGRARSNRA
jgi:ArsR family metal-binding transcriptional regulator